MPIIQGNLPFQSLAPAAQAFQGLGGTPQQAMAALGPSYAASYGAALDLNQANYGNILKGFQDTAAQQQAEQQQISGGYGALRQDIRDQLAGYGRSMQNDLNAQYAQAQGAAGQSLISRGLGNSTIASSVNRGLQYDRARADIDLQDRLTAQRTGYDASIGGAGLAFNERAAGANTALAQNQLGWMNSVNAPYPNAQLYSQLAGQYGAIGQADKDRQAAQAAAAAANAAANRPQAGPTSMGGGSGFFTPGAGEGFAGLGGAAPSIGTGIGPMRRFAPPLGAVTSQAQGDAAAAYFGGGGVLGGGGQPAVGYSSGLGQYGAPASGFGGGFGSQGYGYADPTGEDQPYGQPQPGMAVQPGGYSPYGARATGSTYASPASGLGAYQNYGYGVGGGGDLGYGTQSSQDLYGAGY